MNWTLAIDINHKALLRLLAAMFAVAGLAPGGRVASLPRSVRLRVLHILRPSESALRRLLVACAQRLSVPPVPPRAAPCAPIPRGTGTPRLPSFPLFDPRKHFSELAAPLRYPRHAPRIWFPGADDPTPPAEVPPAPLPDDHVGTERLCRRLAAIKLALDDLPKQARRMARAMAARRQAPPGPRRRPPLRPGTPPGHRKRGAHDVDEVLRDCHALAVYALNPDTS